MGACFACFPFPSFLIFLWGPLLNAAWLVRALYSALALAVLSLPLCESSLQHFAEMLSIIMAILYLLLAL